MTIHPRGLIAAAGIGVVIWLAADVRWAVAVPFATLACDWPQLAAVIGRRSR